jgi:hypothetical protein
MLVNSPSWTIDSPFSTPDTTPPVISNVTAGNITSSGVTITWTTDESATSQVEYGTTTAYGSSTPLDAALVTNHSQMLNSLTANTLYNYRVISTAAAGNQTVSDNFTFTTTAPDDTASAKGEWSSVMNWPLVAVHMIPLHTGDVLMWDGWELNGTSSARLWNPTTQTFTNVPNQTSEIFCAGHAMLANGQQLVI